MLARAYLEAGALGGEQQADATHIAVATCARVDVLVSWNFKHIVNLQRIHGFDAQSSVGISTAGDSNALGGRSR